VQPLLFVYAVIMVLWYTIILVVQGQSTLTRLLFIGSQTGGWTGQHGRLVTAPARRSGAGRAASTRGARPVGGRIATH